MDEIAHLEFPPSFEPPPVPPQGEKGANYQAGFGRSTADFIWLCAWASEWIAESSRDAARAAHAIEVLEAFDQTELAGAMDAGSRATVTDAVAQAKRGDGTGLENQVQWIGCSSLLVSPTP